MKRLFKKLFNVSVAIFDVFSGMEMAKNKFRYFKNCILMVPELIFSSLFTDSLVMTGRIHFLMRNEETGKIIYDDWHPNLVVDTGKYHIADQISDQGEAAMSHMAIGTGTTAAVAGDTSLQTELDRNALTSKTQGSGADANKVTYVGDWAAGDGTGAITEAGIFNSASAGVMLSRSVFAVKNKGAGDSLTLTWVITITA